MVYVGGDSWPVFGALVARYVFVPLFPGSEERQRYPPRRKQPLVRWSGKDISPANCNWTIRVLLDNTGERYSPRPGRTVRASRRRHRVGARKVAWPFRRKGQVSLPSCCGGAGRCFECGIAAVLFSLEEVMGDLHAPLLGSVVFEFSDIVDGSSPSAWGRTVISRAGVYT